MANSDLIILSSGVVAPTSETITSKVGFAASVPEFDHGIALKGTLTGRLDFPAQMTAPQRSSVVDVDALLAALIFY